MGKLIHLCLMLAVASQAGAQSASNFDTKIVTPAAPAPKEAAAKPAVKQAPPASGTASRYVGPVEMEPYIESVSAVFLMRGQETDPFGQPQDPNAKPLVKAGPAKARPVVIQSTPFPDIIRMIQVNTIMLGDQSFLVNSRVVRKGEQIPIHFRGKEIRVLVTEVSARQISFRNMETGEVASREMDLLPVGMTPGTKGITAPGVSPVQQNSPIVVDPDEPSSP